MCSKLRELRISVDIAEDELKVVSDEDDDEGPGFWWTSPEQSNKIESHERKTIL